MRPRPSDTDDCTAAELAMLLQQIARAMSGDPLGRHDLASGLLTLSRHLKRRGSVSVRQALSSDKTPRRGGSARRATPRLRERVDIASLDGAKVRRLLEDAKVTKEDLIDIAAIRFGIPRSRLAKERRAEVTRAILSSLDNREAVDIIGEEAARVGTRQSGKWR